MAVCTPRQQQRHQQQQLHQVEEETDVGIIGNQGNKSAHYAISCTAVSHVYPARRVAWRGKATPHNNNRVYYAAGKVAVAGNGHGVIVSCLQQYRTRWGFVRMATSRTYGRTHAMISNSNNNIGRSHGENVSGCFVCRFFSGPATYRGRGVQVGSS